MSCNDKCGYPIKPAPFSPADPGPGPCEPGPCGPHHPPKPPCGPCPPSQYIGSRYVPIFADPIEWNIHRSYESLTIVTHDGESYTSKCNVGPGIDITNSRYWAKTGAYNAQVEQYKAEVKDLSSQVSGFASDNADFREKIDQYDKDNAAMKNTVAANDARVDALAERMTTAETEIDGLQATTAQHTTEIADLHAKDEDLQRQITSNDGDIAALQAKDVEHDSRLNGIDTKLKSHDASIAQNTADIAKNTKNIQDNAAAIAANAHELADHAEQLADHEGRLTAQHKEITANHEAIERLTSVTDGLRADLTEDEAKIESNRDAIAHIQEKDVQQDGRLDALEKRATNAEGRLDGLDSKTDATNTALTNEIDRAKAAELANGKLIAANAKELADHAQELADHEERITALEGDNTTNKQEIADIKAKNTEQDTAIQQNRDSIAHINDSLTGYVKTETYTAGQAQQDEATAAVKATADKAAANIGDWDTAHPGQTIAECATAQENELSEHAGQIATLESDKADKGIADKIARTAPGRVYDGVFAFSTFSPFFVLTTPYSFDNENSYLDFSLPYPMTPGGRVLCKNLLNQTPSGENAFALTFTLYKMDGTKVVDKHNVESVTVEGYDWAESSIKIYPTFGGTGADATISLEPGIYAISYNASDRIGICGSIPYTDGYNQQNPYPGITN